jgi:hypothetical protein
MFGFEKEGTHKVKSSESVYKYIEVLNIEANTLVSFYFQRDARFGNELFRPMQSHNVM